MKLVITKHDILIMDTMKEGRYTMAQIADRVGMHLTNTHTKVTALCAKGFVADSYRNDTRRAGLREGEQRRVYRVTPLGMKAVALFENVNKSLDETGDKRKPSPRHSESASVRMKSTTGKKTATRKKSAAKKKSVPAKSRKS